MDVYEYIYVLLPLAGVVIGLTAACVVNTLEQKRKTL